MRRLMREVATLRTSPPDGLRIVTNEEDILDIVGIIAGPGEPIASLSAIFHIPTDTGPNQRERHMKEDTSESSSSLRRSFRLLRRSVSASRIVNAWLMWPCTVSIGTMLTKIFHPNVSKSGEICVNTLKKDWKREYGIAHILITVRVLPCDNGSLMPTVGRSNAFSYVRTPSLRLTRQRGSYC